MSGETLSLTSSIASRKENHGVHSTFDLEKQSDIIVDNSSEKSSIDTGPTQQQSQDENEPEIRRVSRVLSLVTSRSSTINPGPPPDGGLEAWTVVACGHLIITITWGLIGSWGVFQSYYQSTLGLPPSTITWIGSIQGFLTFFGGVFSGRLTDSGYFRQVFLVGSFFQLLGVFATSWCTTYWQTLLAQGICIGIGEGCLFCPTITVISTYFTKKRSLAIGIVACGSATGGIIFPSMVRQLLPVIGFGWTIRSIGFINLVTLVVCNIFMKTRIAPRTSGGWVEWGAFKELEYTFYALGTFLIFWGVYFAFYFLSTFSREKLNPGLSYTNSLNLIIILNGIGVIGRILPNFFADRIGTLNLLAPVSFLSGVFVLCWIAVNSIGGLYAWSVFYGITAASIQSLFPAALSSLTNDLKKMGVRIGMVFTIVGFAVLIGAPIQGAIITAAGGSYIGAQIFSGISLLMGSGFLVAAKIMKSKKRGKSWLDKV